MALLSRLTLLGMFTLALIACTTVSDTTRLDNDETIILFRVSADTPGPITLKQVKAGESAVDVRFIEQFSVKSHEGEYYLGKMSTTGSYRFFDYLNEYDGDYENNVVISRHLTGNLEQGEPRYVYTSVPGKINYLGDIHIVKSQAGDGYRLELSNQLAKAKAYLQDRFPNLLSRYPVIHVDIGEE